MKTGQIFTYKTMVQGLIKEIPDTSKSRGSDTPEFVIDVNRVMLP
jgi:hypothetical protein